jgi:glutamine amidotransferase-like uncharacterized protein
MKERIFIMNVPGLTATGSLLPSLRMATHMAFRMVNADDIAAGILDASGPERRLFILPGILGEDSPYQHLLKKNHTDRINAFVARGNVFLGICAGAFFVSETTQFVPPWPGGAKGLRSVGPLFNGVANGPLHGYAVRDGLNAVPVRIALPHGGARDIHLPYSMGPVLVPANRNDPGLEIIARYAHTPNDSPAILRQSFGQGAAYLCGPHPEIYYTPIPHNHKGRQVDKARDIMERVLKPHESDRREFWTRFIKRIEMDLSA